MNFTVKGPALGKASVCVPILRALSDWFGIEDEIVQYGDKIETLPTLLAYREHKAIGFLSLKRHNEYAAEVYVMGVRVKAHRQGVGRALLEAGEKWLREQNVEYLQVKTLGTSNPDPGYARTRAFYMQMGFRPLEELCELWGTDNPCLLMVKKL